MPIIETSELSKSFETRADVIEAVQGVDMQVESGEIFGFLGPNGAGKTTTVRMLTTLLQPSGGRATVAGHDILQEPARVRERIGYVSQQGGADETATARENLVLQARLYGMSATQALTRTDELLSILELDQIANRPVKSFSGGQQRRLDLALGIVHSPDLLFLDEPTTGLDPQGRARLWDEVIRLHEAGTTVFLTTHYLDEADALCNRLAIIDHGQIVAEGSPDTLKRKIAGDVVSLGLAMDHNNNLSHAQEALQEMAFVREISIVDEKLRLYVEDGESALPAILRQLDEVQLDVETISLARPSLDDVFLRQTGRSLRDTE